MKNLLVAGVLSLVSGVSFANNFDISVTVGSFVDIKDPDAVVQENMVSVNGKSYKFDTKLKDMMSFPYSVEVLKTREVDGEDSVESTFLVNLQKNTVTLFSSKQEIPMMKRVYSQDDKVVVELKQEPFTSYSSVIALREDSEKGLVFDYGVNQRDLSNLHKLKENDNSSVEFVIPSFKENHFFMKDIPVELDKKVKIVDFNDGTHYLVKISKKEDL